MPMSHQLVVDGAGIARIVVTSTSDPLSKSDLRLGISGTSLEIPSPLTVSRWNARPVDLPSAAGPLTLERTECYTDEKRWFVELLITSPHSGTFCLWSSSQEKWQSGPGAGFGRPWLAADIVRPGLVLIKICLSSEPFSVAPFFRYRLPRPSMLNRMVSPQIVPTSYGGSLHLNFRAGTDGYLLTAEFPGSQTKLEFAEVVGEDRWDCRTGPVNRWLSDAAVAHVEFPK